MQNFCRLQGYLKSILEDQVQKQIDSTKKALQSIKIRGLIIIADNYVGGLVAATVPMTAAVSTAMMTSSINWIVAEAIEVIVPQRIQKMMMMAQRIQVQ